MTPELKAKLLRYANECEPFTAHNHIEITDIGEGRSRVELHLTCESMNRWGQPHGGILFTLADDACGIAMSGLRQETCVTVSSTVDFMAPAGDALAEHFKTISFGEPQIPVIFNCLGAERPDGAAIPELLVRQVQSSVYMEDSLRRMAAMGLDALVEIGPGKALSGFVKKTVPELPVYAVETGADLEKLTELLKGETA